MSRQDSSSGSRLVENVLNFGRLAQRFAGGDAKRFLDTTLTKGAVTC